VIRRGAWCCRPATTHEVDKNTLPVGVPSDVRACSGDGDMGGLFFVQVALPPARAPAASPRVSAGRTSARALIEVASFRPLLRMLDSCSSAGRCRRAGAAALPVRQRCQCVPAALPARQTLALHRRQSLARPGEAGLDYYYMGGLSADRAPHRRSSAKRPRRSTRAWRLRAGESSRLPACGWGPCWALARAAPAQGISTRMQCHQLPGGGPEVLPCAA